MKRSIGYRNKMKSDKHLTKRIIQRNSKEVSKTPHGDNHDIKPTMCTSLARFRIINTCAASRTSGLRQHTSDVILEAVNLAVQLKANVVAFWPADNPQSCLELQISLQAAAALRLAT
jgi:hypothetical protein